MGRRSRARLAEGDEAVSGALPSDGATADAKAPGFFARRRVPFSKRERLGHEAPGSVLRGPPVTITCECGNEAEVKYGATWQCERCGRRYDTSKIPRDQYEQIRATVFRYRLVPIGLGVISISLAIFFTLTGNILNVFILLPSVLLIWFMLIRPAHRRSFQRAIADLPTWDLRADSQ